MVPAQATLYSKIVLVPVWDCLLSVSCVIYNFVKFAEKINPAMIEFPEDETWSLNEYDWENSKVLTSHGVVNVYLWIESEPFPPI